MKETIKNLVKAFIGESQARNRYTFYAKIAKNEGYEQIAEIFTMTADNEREHASWLFKHINELKKESTACWLRKSSSDKSRHKILLKPFFSRVRTIAEPTNPVCPATSASRREGESI